LCVAAIQALVSLNEQISTSLALPDGEEEPDFQRPSPRQLQDGGSVACRQQQALDSSMALMRRLLVDAQVTIPLYSLATYATRLGLKTPWSESASELYRSSDRCLSAKLLLTAADRECHVVSVTDPYCRILGFLDRSRYFFFQVAPQLYSRG
jgi:hypothetical protein